MYQASFREKLRYRFDNFMSGGSAGLVLSLGVMSGALILTSSVFMLVAGIAPTDVDSFDFKEGVWMSLGHTFDASAILYDVGWGYRFVMLSTALGGILITSMLISVLTTGLESKLTQLRKGRSRVVEQGHTVVLGWSTEVFDIVEELVKADKEHRGSCIVVMGDKDKVAMEEELADKIGPTGNTRIVCRSGHPIDLSDLRLVSLDSSSAIIVVAPECEDPDLEVIKTLMAITNRPDRRKDTYHIMVELKKPSNVELARLVAGSEVEFLLSGELTAQIIAQACLQTGISAVFEELLGFEGDEMYFCSEPLLAGRTFGEVLMAYPKCAPLGLRPKHGAPKLNPPLSTLIEEGDDIIAITASEHSFHLGTPDDVVIDRSAIVLKPPLPHPLKKILMLGWNWRAPIVIRELDIFVSEGSETHVLGHFPLPPEEMHTLLPHLHHKVTFVCGDSTDRVVLKAMDLPRFDHVAILSCFDTLDEKKADACTLISLVHLRALSKEGQRTFTVCAEILDSRNRAIAEATKPDDLVVSPRIVSQLMAQGAKNQDSIPIFRDIFDSEGSEIYLRPSDHYVCLDRRVNFYTVVEAAKQRGEVAIGYRLKKYAFHPEKAYGVLLNPLKSDTVSFSEGDRIIVVAKE